MPIIDIHPHVIATDNVIHAPPDQSLASMMASGELQAGFTGPAGIGRAGAQTANWEQGGQTPAQSYPELIPNVAEVEADWYRRTGIYPIHGTIVVKDAILAEHPWVAKSLFDAFSRAKDEWLARLDAGEEDPVANKKYVNLRKIVGHDPLPYGLEANLPTIRALEDTAFKQQLTPRRMSIEELFVNPEKG